MKPAVPKLFAAIAVLLASANPARAQEDAPFASATFVVDFAATDPAYTWIAAAFENFAYSELAEFKRLEPIFVDSDSKRPPCPDRAAPCLLAGYSAHDAVPDVILLGTTSADEIRYSVHESWTGSKVSHGRLSIEPGADLTRLRLELLRAFHPILRVGGLLESKHLLLAARDRQAGGDLFRVSFAFGLVLLLAALLLVAPYLALAMVIGTRAVAAMKRTGTWRWSGLGVAVLLAVAIITAVPALRASVDAVLFAEAWARYRGPVFAFISGIAWGSLGLLLLRVVVAPLHGIENVRAKNLMPILFAWTVVTGMRLAITASLCLVVITSAATLGSIFTVGDEMFGLAVVPAVGAFLLFFGLVVVDALSLFLDTEFGLVGKESDGQEQEALRAYFEVRLRRAGVPIGPRLLKRTLFVITNAPAGVSTYGGGLCRPRVVVDREVLALALGGTTTAAHHATSVDFDAWISGWTYPGSPAPPHATHRGPVAHRPMLARMAAAASTARVTTGQSMSLLGYILPALRSPAEAEPESELRPHYAAREMKLQQTASESGDPTHRDFLFGPLLAAFGTILRWDSVLGTAFMALVAWSETQPKVLRRVVRALSTAYHRLRGHWPTVIADSYAALHQGSDHLIQFLYYRHTLTTEHLTANASTADLVATSIKLLQKLEAKVHQAKPAGSRPKSAPKSAQAPSPQMATAVPRSGTAIVERLRWLSDHTHLPTVRQRRPYTRIAFAALLTAALCFGAVRAAIDVLRYRPTYEQRLAAMQAEQSPSDEPIDASPKRSKP